MALKDPAPRASEIAIGCGYDISIDLSLKYRKGITLSNVSQSIKRDWGGRTRFGSEVLSFQQMSEQFNQEISLTGEIPSGHFNAVYDFSGCWQKDAANTKTLAFDGVSISLYTVALEKSQMVLCDHVKEAVPASWEPAALARFIDTFGTHIIVGVKMGGKDVIYMKQHHSSTLQPADVQKKLRDMADKRFIDTNGQYSMSSQHMFKNDEFEIGEQQLQFADASSSSSYSHKEDIVTICKRRGGSDVRSLSHKEWLETVQSEPDVISMSFIPITSLLNEVPGCAILCQAIDLYLRFKPPIKELPQFLESMLPRQPVPVSSDLIQVSTGKRLKLNEGSASTWSEIPEDVAGEFLCRLDPKDRVHFGVVCKDWSRTNSLIPEMNLPWLLSMKKSWGNSFCLENYQLYNPWGRETFSMTTEFSSEFEVLAVKSKWILLEMSQSRFYYFNPYSKKIVKVPTLWDSNETRQYKATFTVSDTSEFCFFLIENDRGSNGLIVRVRSNCAEKRLNEEKCLDVGIRDINFQEIIHLVADKEKLFVIFYNRSVGLFSHSDWSHPDWSILIEAENIPVTLSLNKEPDYVFCDGNLFRVQAWTIEERSWKIYILNRTEKKWIQYNFECSDKVLFLSRCKTGRTLSRFALMIRRNMSGRIYYCKAEDGDEDWCYVYEPNVGARRSFPWPHVPTLFKIWIASPS